ncbi:MAG: dienelactone hydrolase family protein [Myxococcales bacterium]|nr:dienelactone hydrolase family protein [Myxococcales bacterium]
MHIEGFQEQEMTFLGQTRPVFKGGTGPAVIVMHEVPGLHPGVIEFGRRVIERGMSVYMPSMLGTPGKPFTIPYTLQSMARACIAKEFTTWATKQNSPITDWLRQLAKHAHEESGGKGVGAIGMCLTGGFALAMMVDDIVLAPVLSQPSLPFGITAAQKRDLGIDDQTLERIKTRTKEEDICVMGLRFTGDRLVPKERFQRLHEELGDKFISVDINSKRGNPHGIKMAAHSVLTLDLVDQPGHPTQEALHRVLDFFQKRLVDAQ